MKKILRDEIAFSLVDTTGPNNAAIISGIKWLLANGGGCIASPNKRTMENFLGAISPEPRKLTSELEKENIHLSCGGVSLPMDTDSVLSLYTGTEIDGFLRGSRAKRVYLIPWKEDDASWFKSAYRPVIVDSDFTVAERQPEYGRVQNRIPKAQDETLVYFAEIAAAYGYSLQWREIQRFKMDLMQHRSEWMSISLQDVWLRCADLGMSANDSNEVRDLLCQLHEGHNFRPARI